MKKYTCHHLRSHKIVLKNEEDMMMDALIKRRGWYDAGYCFAYLPPWLEKELRKDAKKLVKSFKALDDIATKMESLCPKA